MSKVFLWISGYRGQTIPMTAGNFASTASTLGGFIPGACFLKQSAWFKCPCTLPNSACKSRILKLAPDLLEVCSEFDRECLWKSIKRWISGGGLAYMNVKIYWTYKGTETCWSPSTKSCKEKQKRAALQALRVPGLQMVTVFKRFIMRWNCICAQQ